MSVPLRVVLADDHVVLRVGLKAFLEDSRDPVFDVVGQASDGHAALELVEKLQPDLLVLDVAMEGMGGLETTLELRRRGWRGPILILTQHAEPVHVARLLEAGANGYILKSARGEELISAMRAVVNRGTYVDPALAGALLTRQQSAPAAGETSFDELTPREKQILKMVAEGLTNKEVATALGVAVKTVMAHRANLMDKLDIHNHAKLVQYAIKVGLLPPP